MSAITQQPPQPRQQKQKQQEQQQQQQQQLRALYDSAGDASSNTPAFSKGEVMTLVTQHPNGWLEVETGKGTRGYVAPAWVETVPPGKQPSATPYQQQAPEATERGPSEEEHNHDPPREQMSASSPEEQQEQRQKVDDDSDGDDTENETQQQDDVSEDQHTPLERKATDQDNLASESRPLVVRRARARKPEPPKRQSSIISSTAAPPGVSEESSSHAPASTPAGDKERGGTTEDSHPNQERTATKQRSDDSVHVSWDDGCTKEANPKGRRHEDAASTGREESQARSQASGGHTGAPAEDSTSSAKPVSKQSSTNTHTRSRSEGQPRIFFPSNSDRATRNRECASDGGGASGGDDEDDDGIYDNIQEEEQQEQADSQNPASASAASHPHPHMNVSDGSEDVAKGGMREAPKSAPLRPRPRPRPNRPNHSRQPSHAGEETRPEVSPKPKRASVHGAFQQQLEATLVLGGKPPRPAARSIVIEGDAAAAPPQPPPPAEKPRPFRKAPAPPPAVKARRPSSQIDATDGSKPGSEHLHSHPHPQRRPHHSRNASGNVAPLMDRPDEKQQQQQQRQQSGKQSPASSPPPQQQPQQQQPQQHQPPASKETQPDKGVQAAQAPPSPEGIIALHGPLERKPIRESGRDVRRRQWHKVYAVVEGPLLVLFSSKKDFEKQKRPTAVVDLGQNSARIDKEYTKRDFVFTLEGDHHKMLFQAPSEADLNRWLKAMQHAKSSPGTISASSAESRRRAQTYAAPVRERASPKAKRHSVMPDGDIQAPASSTKDKDSGYSYVRRRLNKYLRARPKKQDLVSQGIIEYPVFGGTIKHQVEVESSTARVPSVPIIVVKCVHRVEQSLQEQGIYRVPGNAAQIQHLVAETNADCVNVDVESVEDVHAAAGLLKLYFRELADPPFTDAKYSDFIAAGRMKDPAERRAALRSLFASLPKANQATLIYLFQHLSRVAEHGAVNKMHLNNVAIVFGPTLLRSSEPTLDAIVMDAPFQSSVVEELIKNQDTLSS